MEILLKDYERILEVTEKAIDKNADNGSINDIKRTERLQTKASECRGFIVGIKSAMTRRSNENSGLNIPIVNGCALTKLECIILLPLAEKRMKVIDKMTIEYHELGHLIEKLKNGIT